MIVTARRIPVPEPIAPENAVFDIGAYDMIERKSKEVDRFTNSETAVVNI